MPNTGPVHARTHLERCNNVGCKNNSCFEKKWEQGAVPKCNLKEVHLIMSYGRSTEYAHILVCYERDGYGYY